MAVAFPIFNTKFGSSVRGKPLPSTTIVSPPAEVHVFGLTAIIFSGIDIG